MRGNKSIDLKDRYLMSIEEASLYFHIGEKKLRTIAENNPNANYILSYGNRILIKRKLFEKFIDSVDSI